MIGVNVYFLLCFDFLLLFDSLVFEVMFEVLWSEMFGVFEGFVVCDGL